MVDKFTVILVGFMVILSLSTIFAVSMSDNENAVKCTVIESYVFPNPTFSTLKLSTDSPLYQHFTTEHTTVLYRNEKFEFTTSRYTVSALQIYYFFSLYVEGQTIMRVLD